MNHHQRGSDAARGPAHAAAALDAIIAGDRLDMAFQPIVEVRRGRIVGVEALCRPSMAGGPGLGFDGPAEMFDAAAATGRLWPLEALARSAALHAAGVLSPGLLLFLNCSPAVLADRRFVADLTRTAHANAVDPPRIVLEITEQAEPPTAGALARGVADARSAGFQIAMDDAGTRASGLARLVELRPHWLKLDRRVVRGVSGDPVRRELIGGLARFSAQTGILLIAEGIESADDLGAVEELGVSFAQGFAVAKPQPAARSGRTLYLPSARRAA